MKTTERSGHANATRPGSNGAPTAEAQPKADARVALAAMLAQDDAQATAIETRPAESETSAPPTEDSPASEPGEQTEAATESTVAEETPAAAETETGEAGTVTDLSTTESEGDEPEAEPEADPKGVAKRIGKLKAKHAEELERVETELQTLREELTQLKQTNATPAAEPDRNNPWSEVGDAQQLERAKRQLHDFMDWAEENPEGGQYANREFDAEQVRSARRNARRALDLQIPQQEKYLANYQNAHAAAIKALPYLNDRRSAEYTDVQEVLRAMPGLKARPDHEYWAAAIVEGHKAIQARLAAKGKPQPKPVVKTTPPAAPKAPASVSPRVDPKVSRVQSAKDKVLKSGSRDDFANLLSALG